MTVYVDDMKAKYAPPHAPGRTYIMCHMFADTEEEMHAMATRLGVRKYYQGDHYDITLSKRALAVKYGAKQITWRELAQMVNARRKAKMAAMRGAA